MSTGEWIGIGAYGLALLLLLFEPRLALIPLVIFLLVCFTAPFFPGWSFFLPIINRGRSGRPAVVLTFDDGPDPVSTHRLLDLLAKHRASATFFVTGVKAQRHPTIIHDILAKGHTIGNHTHSHDNFIMLKSLTSLIGEIEAAQQVFRDLGFTPLVFRPPVGITNPRLAEALHLTGLYIVNFSKRAGDRGNRSIAHLSRRILNNLRGDDIIMLHDIKPATDPLFQYWLSEVDRILAGIQERGLEIRPLAELIERPVMESDMNRLCPLP